MKKYLLSALIASTLTACVVLVCLVNQRPQVALGSVTVGGDYQSTTTRTFVGVALTNLTVLSAKNGALNRVTVTGTNGSVFRLWDATTTDVNKRNAVATSSLNYFEIGTNATGTLEFDAELKYGLLYESISGTVSTSTILWR